MAKCWWPTTAAPTDPANWPPRKEAPDHWAGYVVVQEHWKLLVSADSSHAELYELQKDPLEKEDLSQSRPKVVAELRRKLATSD